MEAATEPRTRRAPGAAPAPRGRTRLGALARRIDPLLLAIVVAGTLFSAWYTRRVTDWALMTDELQVMRLAMSVADTGNPLPHIRGVSSGAYSQLYPLLISPIVGLFDTPTAFKGVHLFNSLLMASTAVPAYLLTRDVVRSRGAALLVAALVVVVPWIGMSVFVLTEVVAYPAFAWAAFAIYRTMVRPSAKADVLALVGVAVAFLARTQFVILAAALPIAVLAHEVGHALPGGRRDLAGRTREALRRTIAGHKVLATVSVIGFVVGLGLLVTGHVKVILGNYSVTANSENGLFPPGTARAAGELIAVMGVGVGIVPLVVAGGWAISTLIRPEDRRAHALAVLLTVTTVLTLVQVASFLVRFSGVVQDRYAFYLLPLAFAAMAACLLELRRRWVAVAVAGGVFAWITTLAEFRHGARPFFGSPPSTFDRVIVGRTEQLRNFLDAGWLQPREAIVAATILVTAALAIAIASRRLERRVLLAAAFVPVIVFCAVETGYTNKQMIYPISGRETDGRDWVDRHVPDGKYAAEVPGGVNQNLAGIPVFLDGYVQKTNWWHIEFWNKSVQRQYAYEGESHVAAPFSTPDIEVDDRTGVTTGGVDTEYLVVSPTDVRLRLRGTRLATDPETSTELIRAPRPLRAAWVTGGLDETGWTPKSGHFTLRVFADPGESGRSRRVSITLDSVPSIKTDRPVEIAGPHGRLTRAVVKANTFRTVDAEVCAGQGPATKLTVRVGRGKPFPGSDTAQPGLHVSKIAVGPPGGRCG